MGTSCALRTQFSCTIRILVGKKSLYNRSRANTSILHHAFISIFIALWVVIMHYVTILMPILFYLQGLHKEGECRQLGFWLEKEQILETYSAQLKSPETSRMMFSKYIKNIGLKNFTRWHTCPRGWGARPTPWARPLPRGQGVGPLVFIFGKDFSLFIIRYSVEFQDFWSFAE